MIELNNYLQDGANWQAKCILAYLQSHYEYAINSSYNPAFMDYTAKLLVGRYENGREKGYVVSVLYGFSKQKTFAFYEHRNSDNIYVLHTDTYLGFDTPNKEIIYNNYQDKWDCDKYFRCGEFVECGKYILEEIRKFVEKCVEDDAEYYEKMKSMREEMDNVRNKFA